MEKINQKIRLYIQFGCFVLIWGLLVFISGSYPIEDIKAVLYKIPQAVTIYAVLFLLFEKYLWRWHALNGWLVKIPDLQGTWEGELISTWVNPETGEKPNPIPTKLVIKQTFNKIECYLYTEESSSYSMAADFFRAMGDQILLSYTYTNRPRQSVRERSEVHDGAALLRITDSGKGLSGEYWSSRKTTGEMKFKFTERHCHDSFLS